MGAVGMIADNCKQRGQWAEWRQERGGRAHVSHTIDPCGS